MTTIATPPEKRGFRLFGVGKERRKEANKQKEALFYDSGERVRMWLLVGALALIICTLLLVVLVAFAQILHLSSELADRPVYGIAVHDDGTKSSLGRLSPFTNDATETILERNADWYIRDLFTVTTSDQMERNRDSLFTRTAANTTAETFTRTHFDNAIPLARNGHKEVQHIECVPEGTVPARIDSTKGLRFNCDFDLVPTDGSDTRNVNGTPAVAQHYKVTIEVLQSRNPHVNADLLLTNPDEVYARYISMGEAQ